MYNSEQDFSEVLVTVLRKRHAFVQRMESAMTGRGIPDVFLATDKVDVWIELKNMKRATLYDERWKITWNPGQQAWAIKYLSIRKRHTYTVVALVEGYLIIPMIKLYANDVVYERDVRRCTDIKDIFDVVTNFII